MNEVNKDLILDLCDKDPAGYERKLMEKYLDDNSINEEDLKK